MALGPTNKGPLTGIRRREWLSETNRDAPCFLRVGGFSLCYDEV